MKIDMVLHQEYKERYYKLLEIMRKRPLNEDENSLMYQLAHPPWGDGYEVWTYCEL